jgi:large subunit ribosomal protein L20
MPFCGQDRQVLRTAYDLSRGGVSIMPRAKGGPKTSQRRKRVLKRAKGYVGGRSRLYRTAVDAVHRALAYAYADRKARKGDFRRLWITRINAAARMNGLTYSRLMEALKKAHVELDRKILADLAVNDPSAFSKIAEMAKTSPSAAK